LIILIKQYHAQNCYRSIETIVICVLIVIIFFCVPGFDVAGWS
jgi:hypothetical protein